MYVYIKSEKYLWTVGFYGPQGFWHPESDHDSPEKASKRVALLNGSSTEMTREDFMEFFRNDEKLNTLSPDDRIEIFSSIPPVSNSLPVDYLQKEMIKAINELAKESTAPDKDTPDWMENDIKRGMQWMHKKLTGNDC